jgi:hypothetical protein
MTRALSTPPVISSGSLSGFPQPVLPVAQGLLLRPWEPADAPAFLSAYADGEIRRWHTRRPRTEADVQEWFDAYRQDWKHEKGGHWAVARDDGEVLGRIALRGDGAFGLGAGGDRLLSLGAGPFDAQSCLLPSRRKVRLPARRHQAQCGGA